MKAETFVPKGWIYPPSPGYTDERIWLYLAEGLSPPCSDYQMDDDEVIEVVRVPPVGDVKAMIEDGGSSMQRRSAWSAGAWGGEGAGGIGECAQIYAVPGETHSSFDI